MKKIICVGLLCVGLLFTGCGKKVKVEEKKPVSRQCDGIPEYVATVGDRNVFFYCVTDYLFDIDGETVDLRDYIMHSNDSIDKIISNMVFFDTFDDSGSEFYRGGTIDLLKCNVGDASAGDNIIEGNRDIYIEAPGLTEYFCDRIGNR